MIINNPLKVFSRYCQVLTLHKRNIINRNTLRSLKIQCSYCNRAFSEDFQLNETNDFYNKIIYNEILVKLPVKKKVQQPIFLKYLTENNNAVKESTVATEPEIINFPFDVRAEVLPEIQTVGETVENEIKFDEGNWKATNYKIDKENIEHPYRWNITTLKDNQIDDVLKFGTCDPSVPVSRVPCGGCGAFFHCTDPSIPGFVPREIFINSSKEKLQEIICQRCHFLRTFDVALGVHVSMAQYEQIISTIQNKVGLVIFMIDLLDFPCSIHKDIFKLIGPTKPVVVVGNKVDLLLQESPTFLQNFKDSLLASLREMNFNIENIKHVALISAKTGYGIEDLVTTLQLCWGNEGDVYLIGCTNVGKSSLFNTLLQSDYCKLNAVDILQRATVSAWPGTTLNLLKFPISKVVPWRLAARQQRLLGEHEEKWAIQKIQYMGEKIRFQQIPLTDHVGITCKNKVNVKTSAEQNQQKPQKPFTGLNLRTSEFAFSKWFYDTPGVVHQDQILNLLTTAELVLTLPTKLLVPRNFRLRPGHSIFIGGLARLDYISGPEFVWFTVFASDSLPVTVTKVEDADFVYQKLLGSPLFRVPSEGKERLKKWPSLSSKKFEICGTVPRQVNPENNANINRTKEADADVVLSSAGWISVNVPSPYRSIMEAWTPEGRGIHVRKVPIIKKGKAFRGSRIMKSPAYKTVVKEQRAYNIADEPPF